MRRLTFAVLPFLLLATACSGSTTPDLGRSSSSGGSSGGSSSGAPGPTTPPQSAFDGKTIGCSNVSAYRATADGTQFLTVFVDREKLGLEIGSKATYDLAQPPSSVKVGIDVWKSAPTGETYCTDFGQMGPGNASTTWEAEAGTITIELMADPAASPGSSLYLATITIANAHFVGPQTGVAAFVPKVVIEKVRVGWLPG